MEYKQFYTAMSQIHYDLSVFYPHRVNKYDKQECGVCFLKLN